MSKGKCQQEMEHNWFPLEFQLPDSSSSLRTSGSVGLVGLYCFQVGLYCFRVGLIVLMVGWIVLFVNSLVLYKSVLFKAYYDHYCFGEKGIVVLVVKPSLVL